MLLQREHVSHAIDAKLCARVRSNQYQIVAEQRIETTGGSLENNEAMGLNAVGRENHTFDPGDAR